MLFIIALSVDVMCCVCSSDDETDNNLGHFFQCIWCQKFVHENCIIHFEQVINSFLPFL